MAAFDQYDTYLAQDFSVDHWADYAIDQAQQLLEQFDPMAWARLEATWRHRASSWQQRCAETLAAGPPSRTVPMLVAMVQAGDDELAVVAADTLREFDPMHVAPLLDSGVREQLHTLAEEHPGITAQVINDLLKRV